ncbi:7502_t:CDS:2 [Funneliformis mosseae]|uniref:7502_t:CDS:1 n=1 Tax=Funneliformis mosseae TaxID=27381 RepID=A0A9N9H703_FUNMO|nr:7502_t:CDS:2 [Funneliformis mosseae]
MFADKLFVVVANNFFTIISLTIVSYVIQFYINYFNRKSKLPGPLPVPILGNLHQIGNDFPLAAESFRQKYGDLYEFYMGSTRHVVISRADLAEKVWGPLSIKNTKFIMRNAYSEGVDELGLGTRGMVLNRDIESWSFNRKFLVQSTSSPSFLREAIKLTSKVNEEVFKYWKIMEKVGMPISIPDWMDVIGIDVVVTTATGKRMSSTAEFFNKLNINEQKSEIKGMWNNGIKFAEAIFTYNESMAFMIDLEKISVGKNDQPLANDQLSSILREVFTGGLDTTSNTISYVIYFIAKYRDIYLKIRDEVLKVYGTLDNPNIVFESFEKLKYMDAVIQEAIRCFPTISLISRAATEDVDFDGFIIEADTTVYTNLKALSNNPKYFTDPEKFNPDRFLNDKGSMVKYSFLPFGNGVRMCPGRAWAMVQMKTFLIKLVSTFDIELVDKNAEVKYKYATVNRPVDINLHIKARKD